MKNMMLWQTLIGIVLLTSTLFGQTAVTLRGQVIDELGAALKGANVAISAGEGGKRTATTNARGEFTISNLPAGTYNLIVEYKGFQNYVENGIQPASMTLPLKVVMKVATVNESTDVPADGRGVSVEPDQSLTGIVLDEKMIQELLPETEEEMAEFLQALAGGTGNAQIMIDGFRGGRMPPRESIMQVRINQNLFSPEFSSGGGDGRIEIITRPGSGEWRGNVSFGLRNSALDARNAFALVKPELDQQRYTFFLGGPVIPKRLDFSANVDWAPTDGSGLVSATTLDGLFTANVPAPSRSKGYSFRSGLFINKRNMLRMNYNYRGSERTNSEFATGGFGGGNFGGGGFGGAGGGGRGGGGGGFIGGGGFNSSGTGGSLMLPERASSSESANHSFSFSETFLINTRMIHEARLRLQRETSRTLPVMQAVAIDVLDAFQGGGSTRSSDSRSSTIEFQDSLTTTFKKHTIKVGLQFEQQNVRDLNLNNFNGTYSFSTLDQYGRASLGEPVSASLFTINRAVNGGDPSLRYSQYEASWYMNDDIRLSQSLTISLGLRHEFQQNLDDKLNFAPRFSIAWSPFRNRKTVIRSGGGLFYNRLSVNTYADALRYIEQTQETITLFNPAYFNPIPADLSVLSTVLSTSINRVQQNTREVLDPNLRAPYNISGMLSLEHQLPRALVGTLSYSISRGVHLFRTRNINAPLPETGVRPDPGQGNILATESGGKSIRQELAFGFSRRFSQRFTFFSNYRLAWARDDAAFPANSYDLSSEWARSFSDRRHSFNMLLMVNLPWSLRVTPNVFVNSGAPFNITTGMDNNLDTQFSDRPAGIGRNSDLPASLYPLIPLPGRIVKIAGGSTTTLLDYLNTNFPNGLKAEGPGTFNANIGISKIFGFGQRSGGGVQAGNMSNAGDPGFIGAEAGGQAGGRIGQGGQGRRGGRGGRGGVGGMGRLENPESARFTLRFAMNINNLFNHVNFGQYGGVLGSPYLGRPSNASAPRQLNLNLMFGF